MTATGVSSDERRDVQAPPGAPGDDLTPQHRQHQVRAVQSVHREDQQHGRRDLDEVVVRGALADKQPGELAHQRYHDRRDPEPQRHRDRHHEAARRLDPVG